MPKTLEERNAYQREYRKKNKDKVNGINRRYRARNKLKARSWERKYRHQHLPEPTRAAPDNCEICGGKSRKDHALALDHVTGKFRGWLCGACNLGIGKLGDSVDSLRKALEYLVRNS